MDRNKLHSALLTLVQSPYGNMAKANGIEITACVMEICDGGSGQEKIRYRPARQGEPVNLFSLNVNYAAPQEFSVACVADFFDPRTAQAFGTLIANELNITLQVDPLIRKFDNKTTCHAIEILLNSAFEGHFHVRSSAIVPGYHEVHEPSSEKYGVRSLECSIDDSPEFFSVVFSSEEGFKDTFADCASIEVARAMACVIEQTHKVRQEYVSGGHIQKPAVRATVARSTFLVN